MPVGCSYDGDLDRVGIQSLRIDVGLREDRFHGGHGGVSLLAAPVSVEAVRHEERPVRVSLGLGAATATHECRRRGKFPIFFFSDKKKLLAEKTSPSM